MFYYVPMSCTDFSDHEGDFKILIFVKSIAPGEFNATSAKRKKGKNNEDKKFHIILWLTIFLALQNI